MELPTYDLIVPALPEDLKLFENYKELYRENLGFNDAIIITREKPHASSAPYMLFADENTIIPGLCYQKVREKIVALGGNEKRTGWYFQQFIKMGYSLICQKDYYLLWDADTIPVKKLNLWKKGRPIFHMKEEYNAAYFSTLTNLFGDEVSKIDKRSFICEHMLIKTSIMRELIHRIEGRDHKSFWESILEAVPKKALSESGFSEFETYGNYAMTFHPDVYVLEKYDSCRLGKRFFGTSPTKKDLKWVSRSYATISFEKFDCKSKKMKLLSTPLLRIFPFRVVEKMYFTITSRRARKGNKNGD